MQIRFHEVCGTVLLFSWLIVGLNTAHSTDRIYHPPTLKRSVVRQAAGDSVDRKGNLPVKVRTEKPLVFDSVMGERERGSVVPAPDRRVAPVSNMVVEEEAETVVPEMSYPPFAGASCSCGEPVCGCDASLAPLSCGCEGPVCGCEPPLAYDGGCDSMCGWGDVSCDRGCDSGGCGCGTCALCIFDLVCLDVRVPSRSLYGKGEVILWWQRGESLPELVADGAGNVLIGDARTDSEANAGFRLSIGRWLDNRRCRALEFRYWGAGEQDFNLSRSEAAGGGILVRPFINAVAPLGPATQPIANTGNFDQGAIAVTGRADMYGVDLMVRRHLSTAMNGRIDWLWGYQTTTLDSQLTIASASTAGNPPPGTLAAGEVLGIVDNFLTQNEFHGAAFGIRTLHRQRCWSLGTMFKLAFGGLSRDVVISGSRTTNAGTTAGGLLTQPSNIGAYSDSTFAVLPEINVTLGYRIRRNVDFTIGYNYLMMNKVTQPWRAIDPGLAVDLDPQVVQRPLFVRNDGPFWIQGINFGLACKY